jgi:hypothetical protein
MTDRTNVNASYAQGSELAQKETPGMSEEDSDVEGSNGRSFSSSTDKTTSNVSEAQEIELAQKETKLVKRSKCLVLFVLLAAAAGCGAGKLLLLS